MTVRASKDAAAPSRAQLQAAFAHSGEDFWDWDLEAEDLYMSPRLVASLGYRDGLAADAAMLLAQMLPPQDFASLRSHVVAVLRGEAPMLETTCWLRDHEGTGHLSIVRGGVAARRADGRVVRMLGTVANFSTTHRRFASLLDSSSPAAVSLVDGLQDPICLIDATGEIHQGNEAWRRYTAPRPGMPPAGNANYFALCAAARHRFPDPRVMMAGLRALLAGERATFEHDYAGAGGATPTWTLVRMFRSGESRAVVCHQDVTARRQAELAQAEERERLQLAITCLAEAILSTDSFGRVESLNPAAEDLTGWSLGDARGLDLQQVLTLVRPDTGARVDEVVRSCLYEGQTSPIPTGTLLRTRSGDLRPVAGSLAPLRNYRGQMSGAVIIARPTDEVAS